MAQGNQVRGALRTLNGRDTGHAQHITFLAASCFQHGIGWCTQLNRPDGHGLAFGFIFATHIHHVRIAFLIKMRQSIHTFTPSMLLVSSSFDCCHLTDLIYRTLLKNAPVFLEVG